MDQQPGNFANFTNDLGQSVQIDMLSSGKYCITVDGRMTQKDLPADGIIAWMANASHVEKAAKPIRLKFEYFHKHQMGRGFVAYQQSAEERKDGVYDPHVMFAHLEAESDDPETMERVEKDCKELTRLLGLFEIDADSLSRRARHCRVRD